MLLIDNLKMLSQASSKKIQNFIAIIPPACFVNEEKFFTETEITVTTHLLQKHWVTGLFKMQKRKFIPIGSFQPLFRKILG